MITSKITIPAGDLQKCGLGNIPFKLLDACGTNRMYNLIGCFGIYRSINFPYTSNTQLNIGPNSGPLAFESLPAFLNPSSSFIIKQYFSRIIPPPDQDQLGENEAIYVVCPTGDPSGGDGEVDIYITYEVVELIPTNISVNL